jgi:hypothetical protein
MKLKIYFLGALASVFGLQSMAQNSQEAKKTIHSYIQAPEFQQNTKIDYSKAGAKETIFCSEFDDPDAWTLINEGEQGTWGVVLEEDADVLDFMGAMASATADNGFGQFNGISFLLDGDVDVQNSILELNEPVDCSTLSDVAVTFNQRARAFNYDENYLEVSTNGGTSWVPFLVNDGLVTNAPAIQGEITLDITSIAAGESDVRLRFRWVSDPLSVNPDLTPDEVNSFGSGYGWMVDDLCVSTLPENELIIGETYYDDFFETFFELDGSYFYASEETTDLDQVTSFEYHTQPEYSTREFNFACGVTNGGTAEQTGVSLVVTFTDPDGTATEQSSDPITLAPGVTDTIRFYGQIPTNWAVNGEGDLPNGLYEIDFQVVQDQEDELPGNNVGVSRFTRITDVSSADGAIIQHENSLTQLGADGQDIISGTRYSFSPGQANRAITSIRFALNDESADGVGEQVFLNVRTGSVLEEENDDNPMNLFFSYNEDDEDVVTYEVDEDDLSTTSTPNWIEIELPTPVFIEPGLIYQAEMRLPLFGEELVFTGLTSTRKASSSVIYDFDDVSTGPQGWFFFGGSVYNLAFGTEFVTNVSDISYESGIKLTQNYPNPVVDNTMIQFQLDVASAVTFEVFDITGKLVYSEDLGNVPALTNQVVNFNRAGLAAGTYTYGVATENERLTRKMIIQ